MEEFEILVKLTKYQKIKTHATNYENAKAIIAGQLHLQKQNFEFVDIEDGILNEPILLNESDLKFVVKEGESVVTENN